MVLEAQKPITNDAFVVRESAVVAFVVASVFFALFFTAIYMGGDGLSLPLLLFVLTPAILFTMSGILHKATITIDCNGIYHHKQLVTDWPHFVEAYLDQAYVLASYQDNFVLVLRYQKEGYEGCFRMTIPLTNTQDKSEEAVLEAIRRFYELSQASVMPIKQPLAIE